MLFWLSFGSAAEVDDAEHEDDEEDEGDDAAHDDAHEDAGRHGLN